MKHIHHIIPKHMGGSDDPNNLIELTVEEHAEAHFTLYQAHGHWQDKVAWQGLAGLVGHDDIMREMWNARKGSGNPFYGKKHTEEYKQRMSELKKGQGRGIPKGHGEKLKEVWSKTGHPRKGKTPWNKGKTGVQSKSLETKKKISKSVVFNGIEYYSIKEAARANNTSEWYVLKQVKGSNAPTRRCKNTPSK